MTKKSIKFYQEAYLKFKELDTGQSHSKLGEALGVHRTTVSAWRHGRTPESVYNPIDEETLEQAKYMLEQGYTYVEVADFISVQPHTLRRRLPGMGWKNRGPIKRIDYGLDEYVYS